MTGVRKSAHLKGTRSFPPVNIEKIKDEDLKVWIRRDTISLEDFEVYRRKIAKNDYDRNQFYAFMANLIQIRELEKFQDKH